jgi:diguanylate cyclase (GGDEF)-like protein
VGDIVLRRVSDLLRNLLRATDVAGRFGGEEFLVILPQTDRQGAHTLAERWRQSLELTALEAPDGKRIRTTVSIGVAEFLTQMVRPDELVRAADEALYSAKTNGRNRVALASIG